MVSSSERMWRVRVGQEWEINREDIFEDSSTETTTESLEEFEYAMKIASSCSGLVVSHAFSHRALLEAFAKVVSHYIQEES